MTKIKLSKEEYEKFWENNQVVSLGDLFPKDGSLKRLERKVNKCNNDKIKIVSYKDEYYSFDDVRDIIEQYFKTISYTIFEEVVTTIQNEKEIDNDGLR